MWIKTDKNKEVVIREGLVVLKHVEIEAGEPGKHGDLSDMRVSGFNHRGKFLLYFAASTSISERRE